MLARVTSAAALASAIRNIRKNKGLTQQAISREVGIIQATISSFETSPEGTKLETLFKILAALDLQLYVSDRNADIKSATFKATWDQEW